MIDRKTLKEEARLRMREAQPAWWQMMLLWFLAATLVPDALTGLVGNMNDLAAALASGVTDPMVLLAIAGDGFMVGIFLSLVVGLYQIVMNFGLANYALKLWRKEECGHGAFFEGFAMVGRVIWMDVLIGIFTTGWILLMSIPVGIVAGFVLAPLAAGGPAATALFMVVMYLLIVVLLIPIILRYVLATLALADQPEQGALAAIRRSKELMRGHKWEYFKLELSFLGWILLCNLLSIILSAVLATGRIVMPGVLSSVVASLAALPAYLWVVPYMQVASAGFYDALTEHAPHFEPLEETPGNW